MATKVDICNMALATLGDTATVTSIDPPEGSAQADHCARFYPMALRDLLSAFSWRFATRRARLAQISAEVPGEEGTKFYYALPSDCLRVVSVHDSATNGGVIDYSVEFFNWRRVIVTASPDPWIQYVTSEVEESLFTPAFSTALVHRLASMLAGPLVPGSSGVELCKSQLELYQVFLDRAKMADVREGHGRERYRPRFVGDAVMGA